MALQDITNAPRSVKKSRKRLSDGTPKDYEYTTYRKQLEVAFKSESEKLIFETKLQKVKCLIGGKLSLRDVLDNLMDLYMLKNETTSQENSKHESKYENTKSTSAFRDETLYIGDVVSAEELVSVISEHCRLCPRDLQVINIAKAGHVLMLNYRCENGHEVKWKSSSVCGDNYKVNYKVIAAYICSGMTAAQYEKFCDFSTVSIPPPAFRARAVSYLSTIVKLLQKTSIATARREEIQKSKDSNESGISIMTDARHACRKISFHSDHIAIGQKTHKILDVQHLTKREETSSQKHEALGCRKMYEEFDRLGIDVKDHAHDRNTSVNKQVKDRPGTTNSNDAWHGAKPIKFGFKKIASGSRANNGRTWHPELADKGAKFRNHVYFSMEKCNGNAASLRNLLDNSVSHFQNNHIHCHIDSPCKLPGYVADYDIIRSPEAVRILRNFIHSLTVYKSAADFVLARSTYYIESFNNTCLIYLDKRIHYKNTMYELRRDLCVLDWNEHVDRQYTSVYRRIRPAHMGRRSGKKTYKKKTYNFVRDVIIHLESVAGDNRDIAPPQSDPEDESDSDTDSSDDNSDGENN